MLRLFPSLFLCLALGAAAQVVPTPGAHFPNTAPLTETNDLAGAMMQGLHRYAENRIAASPAGRKKFWARDFSTPEKYAQSIAPNRERLQKLIGISDPRVPPRLEYIGANNPSALLAENSRCRIYQVRWTVLEGVSAEGLLLEPAGEKAGAVIVLPDADQTPEQLCGLAPGLPQESQMARMLAERGLEVFVPVLINRASDWSGNPRVVFTNQPHREWIYRQAYHMGRHIVGYEVQKVLAAVDWIKSRPGRQAPVGVAGYGEGALIAFYAAAVDPRIDAALVSGYFNAREQIWKEPLYRNLFGLLREFGDAEIAAMIAPRPLVVEYSDGPRVAGPPPVTPGRRGGAAVGELSPPPLPTVQAEFKRIAEIVPAGFQPRELIYGDQGETVPLGSPKAVARFAGFLHAPSGPQTAAGPLSVSVTTIPDPSLRQERQVKELENHVQRLLREADQTRHAFLLGTTSLITNLAPRMERFRQYRVPTQSAETFATEMRPFRRYFAEEILGRIEEPLLPAHPRSRQIYHRPKWDGYEVVLDVLPDVFAWGILLVPKDIKPGERRPVVVCQHGRSGVPKETVEGDSFYYHDFAARLAEEGFITFAPHNPYRGEDLYRMVNRKANATKLTLFSFIMAQHSQILAWLKGLPFVDPARIAFYGLSYGGETAVRIPPVIEDYSLSICSADFNDWARKVASTDSDYSFMFSVEWEMPYFNMGSTFNYAEAAALMVPRPFMVERGHHDGVAPDPWVAGEYAKVRWIYTQLGLADRTEIEFYNGGHTINGQGTFQFLRKQLRWPPPDRAGN